MNPQNKATLTVFYNIVKSEVRNHGEGSRKEKVMEQRSQEAWTKRDLLNHID